MKNYFQCVVFLVLLSKGLALSFYHGVESPGALTTLTYNRCEDSNHNVCITVTLTMTAYGLTIDAKSHGCGISLICHAIKTQKTCKDLLKEGFKGTDGINENLYQIDYCKVSCCSYSGCNGKPKTEPETSKTTLPSTELEPEVTLTTLTSTKITTEGSREPIKCFKGLLDDVRLISCPSAKCYHYTFKSNREGSMINETRWGCLQSDFSTTGNCGESICTAVSTEIKKRSLSAVLQSCQASCCYEEYCNTPTKANRDYHQYYDSAQRKKNVGVRNGILQLTPILLAASVILYTFQSQ